MATTYYDRENEEDRPDVLGTREDALDAIRDHCRALLSQVEQDFGADDDFEDTDPADEFDADAFAVRWQRAVGS